MKYWERELAQLISGFISQFGCEPTAILARHDAYSRIKADMNTVRCRDGRVIWKGYEVLLVDAPGDRIILDGGVLDRGWEECDEPH